MNKKIGIITYHNAINYGAVLQAYALSHYLNSKNNQVQIVNYLSPAVDIQYRYKTIKESFSMKNFFAHNLTCFLHKKKKKLFKEFLNQMPISKLYTRSDLAMAEYDLFITGSDQVFNPDCNRNDPSFFLDFTEKPKYAYAASMGSIEQFRTSKLDTIGLLASFSKISMREADTADYLSKALDKECVSVMDPVWLLNKSEWEAIASEKNEEKYILVYNLMDFSFMRDYALRLSEKTGLPIYVINRTIIGEYLYWGKAMNKSNCSPQEFLGLIRNSKYFVTDSFHGISFAMIFQKNFVVAKNPGKISTNSRLDCILGQAGLKNRVIAKDVELVLNDIEYKKVERNLLPYIENSKVFLDQICE